MAEIPIQYGKYINPEGKEEKVIFIGTENAIYDKNDKRLDQKWETAESNVGDGFSELRDYTSGDYVIYDNALYKFKTVKPAGAWDESTVERASVAQELLALKTATPGALSGGWLNDELHNQNRGGKILTDFYTYEEILAMVQDGSFSDIYVGDIIERDTPAIALTGFSAAKTQYAIIGINSLNNYGDTPVLQNIPHLVMIPLDGLGSAKMNSSNTTAGGYKGSYMNATVIPAVVKALESAFGAEHVLQTREMVTNEVTNAASRAYSGWTGASFDWGWTNQKAILMSELEVYGATPFSSSGYDAGGYSLQFPGMRINKIANFRTLQWLRSIARSNDFCLVAPSCIPYIGHASSTLAIRPRFVIG